MSVENRPLVVGFDGLHRSGKGTQAELLARALDEQHTRSVILRGDGTREGAGQSPGDPYSKEWQERNHRLKTVDRTVEGWNQSAYILARELHDRIQNAGQEEAIIVDRTLISRAAFLLHRGVTAHGATAELADLYPDHQDVAEEEAFDLDAIVPDVIFDLQADSPEDLLSRLDPDDPKYEFRAQNIRGGFETAQIASQHLPASVQARVETLDAMEPLQTVHEKVTRYLGVQAARNFNT